MRVLLSAALVGCLLSLTVSSKNLHAESDWKLFADKSDGVSFSYPKTWAIEPQRTNAFRVKVGDPNGTGTCMLATIPLPPQVASISAEDMVRQTTKQDIINGARQKGTEMKISNFRVTKVGNRPAIYYEDENTYQSLSVPIPLRSITVLTKVGAQIYTLSCGTVPVDMEINKSRYVFVMQSLVIR